MSDAYTDNKAAKSMAWRRDTHPEHFTSSKPGTSAKKYDAGKTEYHHMPPQAFEMINEALTFGGRKYSAYNWRSGFAYTRCFNAGMRHFWAWCKGENLDPESGLPHLAHGICCFIFLLQFHIDGKGIDDRYTEEKK